MQRRMMHKITTDKIKDLLTQIQYLIEDDAGERGRSVNAAVNAANCYNPDYGHILDSMPGNIARFGDDTWFWEKLSGNDTWEAPDGAILYWNCNKCKYLITMG